MIRTWVTRTGLAAVVLWAGLYSRHRPAAVPAGREEVVFWHFWGGEEGEVVTAIVERFNRSQRQFWVREIAMPGANLDVKLFLAVTGGAPPDLVNQDDPILADWSMRGAIQPVSAVASPEELIALRPWLLPAAWELGAVHGVLFGVCNGLDVRALYYNATLFEEHRLSVPRTIADLDDVARRLTEPQERVGGETSIPYRRIGFLPNPRNLWSWGIVFGGDFFDEKNMHPTPDDPAIVRALDWMASYGRHFGPTVAAYRQRDQSLPGKPFPLLAGHYAMMTDGQWRCRDIRRAQNKRKGAGLPVIDYGVAPFPVPSDGRTDAGWINGNFFVIPKGARNTAGAWSFIKFWSGFGGHEADAAETCAKGYWIPVSSHVVNESHFQEFLRDNPLFGEFVRLAASPHQIPRPNVPSAMFLDRELVHAASEVIFRATERSSHEVLASARLRMEQQMNLQQRNWERFVKRLASEAGDPDESTP